MKKELIANIVRFLLIAMMIGTVLFIFINSMLPPEKSTEQSDTVKDIIVEILPDNSKAENFVEEYMRKIAHFTEYGLLGIELAVYLLLFHRRRPALFGLALTVPFFVGFIDESIQSLSGRGPLIEDVWIDIGGFATFYALTLAVCFFAIAIAWAIKTVKNKREING